jgi:hypothetical protein
MFLTDKLNERDNVVSEPTAARPRRRKVHPLTWIVAALLTPVLLWDVWQTVQDVKHRHQTYVATRTVNPLGLARLQSPFK